MEQQAHDETETPALKKVSSKDKRSFWTLVALSTQNSFNDKASQTMLITLGVFLANAAFRLENHATMGLEALSSESAKASAWISPTLAILILAPFIFLAPFAGWLSDRYSKTKVLRSCALMQLVVLGFIFWTIQIESFFLAIVGFGLLALQSTLFSPAKKGIIKEMMGSEKLGFASGVVELSSVLAICVGQIISGFWFNHRLETAHSPWLAAHWPLLLFFLCSIPALLASYTIKVYPSPSKRPFKINILWEHLRQMKEVLGDSKIRLSALGICFFWFVGGFINITAIQVANLLTSGTTVGMGEELAYLLASASGGVILGGAIASYSCRRSIELGLVPIGGFLMVAGSIALAFVAIDSTWLKIWLAFTGFSSALFLVPLNAHLQDHCSEKKRGKVIAGVNLLNCITGAFAVGLFLGLTALNVSMLVQFLILALLCFGVTIYATQILPQQAVRFTLLTLVRVLYRQKVLHAERIPSTGGVLIISNHVSYIDAFILSAACTRPIRFLVTDGYYKKPSLIRLFLKLFDAVPISEARAKDAMQQATNAIEQGAAVCIFPEGQLSRTGMINELKRGYEMIARKAKCPVIPVYMDGLWGSIFSFERGKYIKKTPYRLPYGVTVHWGNPIELHAAQATQMRHYFLQLGMEAFKERAQLAFPDQILRKAKVTILAGNKTAWHALYKKAQELPNDLQYRVVYNALQIADTYAICRGDTIAIRLDELHTAALSLGVAFPAIAKLKVLLISKSTTTEELQDRHRTHHIKSYIGAAGLEQQLLRANIVAERFYHIGSKNARDKHYPVYAVDHLVVALSMPHPISKNPTSQFQSGWKEGCYGKLLPGFMTAESYEDAQSVYLEDQAHSILDARITKEGYLMVD